MSEDFKGAVYHTREAGETFKGAIFHTQDIGGGGGGKHNLGYYATPAALEEAHPTAEAGDWAIVGSTDTVWIWDTDNSEWIDSDQKGQVTSVNEKTGAVVLTAEDVAAIPQHSTMPSASSINNGHIVQFTGTTNSSYTNGYFYKCSAGSTEITSGSCTVSNFMGSIEDTPVPTISFNKTTFDAYLQANNLDPVTSADVYFTVGSNPETGDPVLEIGYNEIAGAILIDMNDEDVATIETTMATLGFTATISEDTGFASCDVTLPTATSYAWNRIDVQPNTVTSVNGQTGNVTVQETLVSGTNIKTINGNGILGSGNLELSTYLPYPAGWATTGTTKAFCDAVAADTSAVEGKAYLGEVTFSDLPASMANGEVVVEIMDGTTAANKVIVLTLTSGNTAPYMWKYTYWNGGTDVSGWKGFQEQLVSGTNIKTVNNTSLLGGGNITIDSLPSQSGNSGKFLTTDGTDASWAAISALQNTATGNNSLTVLGTAATGNGAINIGVGSRASEWGLGVGFDAQITFGVQSCSYGYRAKVSGSDYSMALGCNAFVANAQNAIQLSASSSMVTNSDANTVKIANSNGNFEIMSADGTVPTDRFTTTPSIAGTYSATIVVDGQGNITRSWATAPDPLPSQTGNAGKVLMTNGTTASWEDVSSSPTTAPTLAAASWSSNQQTVNVTGVTATNTVIVAPIPTDAQDYASAGILCIAQGAGTLTFSCVNVPANDIQVNVVII